MNKLQYRFFQLGVVFKTYLFKLIFVFFHNDCKEVFLISERGTDARDNGYAFYKYMKSSHPECKIKYVITKNSPDINRIVSEDRVFYNSIKHYKYFLYSKYLISTHIMGFTPNTSICMKLNSKRMLPVRGKLIFLQHGITKDYSRLFDYDYTHLDLFVCAAKPEAEFIIKENKYPEGIVRDIGFCRFDNLNYSSDKEHSILIMPTWRHWHSDYSNLEFTKDLFFTKYNELINNDEFINYIEKRGIKVYFYVHYETQRFINLFSSKSKNILICSKEKYDVQDLLIRSKILITDYSSVYFDFAYMKKKVIYYHFDYDKYRTTHPEGYFSYDKHGFGTICKNIEDILLEVQTEEIDAKYLERVYAFFPNIDNNNSERTYQIIRNLE